MGRGFYHSLLLFSPWVKWPNNFCVDLVNFSAFCKYAGGGGLSVLSDACTACRLRTDAKGLIKMQVQGEI